MRSRQLPEPDAGERTTARTAPLLTAKRAARATAVARDVAERMRTPESVTAARIAEAGQTAFPRSAHWAPYSLASGDAGLALMCGYADACFPGDAWDIAAHRYLRTAAEAVQQVPLPPTALFEGLSGLAFTAEYLSRGNTRYRRLVRAVDAVLLPRVIRLADELRGPPDGLSVGVFDLISGLTGVGARLLTRREDGGAAHALTAVLTGLISMCQAGDRLPPWHTPPHLIGDEAMARANPHGVLNCGLAHGIPGPLALLALALDHGVEVRGLPETVERLAHWLVAHRLETDTGVGWPTTIPLTAEGKLGTPPPSRTAWCYGTPGVARALWLAGRALHRADLCDLALDGMAEVYRRDTRDRGIDAPTFCHGVAGLLQITLRFAHDTRRPEFVRWTDALTDQVLAAYEPGSLLGYRDVEPGDRPVDRPGLLDGAPGVVLTLLAAGTRVRPDWDRLFLLS
ncbi:lanthionine synthetase C family protein [Streptomyces sp. NPDC018031]|uniref:lanthionine synthetase C family protein n=1 Tax=Streptomyces sp. NPDC018031 TaxID=3365033 RepID=UPI0037985E27